MHVTLKIVSQSLMRAIHHLQGLFIHCNAMLGFYSSLLLCSCSLPRSHFAAALLVNVRQAWSGNSQQWNGGFLQSDPFQPSAEIRGLCLCSAGVPSLLSPFLPPSCPGLPFSPESQAEEGAQRGSSPSWQWPEAKSPHRSCILTRLTRPIEKWGTLYPLRIHCQHLYIKTYTTGTSYSLKFLSTYLKSTGPSSALNVSSITYCNFCLPHCITLLCNNVNLCELSACYIQSALQKETKQMPLHPHTALFF